MTRTDITTGEQSVSATGAITGSLDTSGLTGDYTVKLRIRGTAAGTHKIKVALEDTANASAFTDATQCGIVDVTGGMPVEGLAWERKSYDIPSTRFGAANTKLRFNCQLIDATTTALVYGWLEQ